MTNSKYNILVTGSNGFIGKNLLKKLIINGFNILEFNRNDSFEKKKKNQDFLIQFI